MAVDYTPLWKLLIDKRLKRSELCGLCGISTNAVAKMGRNERVSLGTLEKVCGALDCDINDVVRVTRSSGAEDGT